MKDRPFKYAKEGDKYDIGKTKLNTPRIDIKVEGEDVSLIVEMVKDTEGFRIDQMLSALGKTEEVATQYEIIVYLLKVWNELTPLQAAKVINCANKLFVGSTMLDKTTVRLAKVLRAFTGDDKKSKTASKDRKFEEIIRGEEEGDFVEI